MMTTTGKIFLIIGILLFIFGLFIEITTITMGIMGPTSAIWLVGFIMVPTGMALMALSLFSQKRYKGKL